MRRPRLYLGHVLFQWGGMRRGEKWEEGGPVRAEPAIAYRALGMAAKTLDGNLTCARDWLEEASKS